MIWSYLLHLSYNMWGDRPTPGEASPYFACQPYLRCDDSLWHDLVPAMADAGVNMVVVDLGDGVRWSSHPEIAVRDAWEPARLQEELRRMRAVGLEPVPKLNFSACHDAWLGPYSRCVSTPAYYEVCAQLIAEAAALFDGPRYFHLGMDEETLSNQRHFDYVVIRQHDLWWHDLGFLADQVRKAGARPWVWADPLWQHQDAYLARMPKDIVQSNWYYGEEFSDAAVEVRAYRQLERAEFDQIPTGSPWESPRNFGETVRHCGGVVSPNRLLGFMQTVWRPTLEEVRAQHISAIEEVRAAREWWEGEKHGLGVVE